MKVPTVLFTIESWITKEDPFIMIEGPTMLEIVLFYIIAFAP